MESASDMDKQQKSLNIAVIVWQVPAMGAATEYDPWTKGIYCEDIVYSANYADDFAVEEALSIRDSCGNVSVNVITIGPRRVEDILYGYLAMGADSAVRVEIQEEQHDIYGLCAALSSALQDKQYDAVVCGSEVTDSYGCTAYPGPFLAGMLKIPYVSGVTMIETGGDDVVVHRKLEHGDREIIRCSMPCLLAVEKGCNEPRQASLPGLIESRSKQIVTITVDIPLQGATYSGEEIHFTLPHKRIKKTMTVDTTLQAADRMKMIMSGGMVQKGGKDQLLKGDINKIAKDLVTIFRKRGIIKS